MRLDDLVNDFYEKFYTNLDDGQRMYMRGRIANYCFDCALDKNLFEETKQVVENDFNKVKDIVTKALLKSKQ